MPDELRDIQAFYDGEPEREDSRLREHQLEFDLTWRFVEEHLPPGARVLDLGAATGGYAIPLAERGHFVTAVDLSPELIDIGRRRVEEAGLTDRVELVVADARDLSSVPGIDYDAVLMLGPLYHLVEEEDRRLALREARTRLRDGGLLLSASLSRLGVLGDILKRAPDWIQNQAEVRSLLDHGKRPDDAPLGGFRGYFASVDEVTPLHESEGFEVILLAGVEPAISADDESYNQLQKTDRMLWLDLLREISTEPSILGASRHLLYIGRKASDLVNCPPAAV